MLEGIPPVCSIIIFNIFASVIAQEQKLLYI